MSGDWFERWPILSSQLQSIQQVPGTRSPTSTHTGSPAPPQPIISDGGVIHKQLGIGPTVFENGSGSSPNGVNSSPGFFSDPLIYNPLSQQEAISIARQAALYEPAVVVPPRDTYMQPKRHNAPALSMLHMQRSLPEC